MTAPLAHETWFVPDPESFPLDWGFAGETETLALLLGAVVIALVVRLVASRFAGVDVLALGRLVPWMPFAMRIHLAVSLLGLLSLGYYLSPAMDLHADVAGVLLAAVMAVVAVGMVTGRHARAESDPDGPTLQRAAWLLRVAVGVALIIVAFREKLASPDMAIAFLTQEPQFNIAQGVGLNISDLEFARRAGGVEVLFGLLLISGALPQAVVILAGIPFNATLYFLGNVELVGHLPIYGTMLVLLVMGSDPRLRPRVSTLWPWRPASGRREVAGARE